MADTTEVTKLVFLTPEEFLELRPAMSTFTNEEIQECINSSTEILNALCNGLVEKVIDYNLVEDRSTLDTLNTLYRTDFEFKQLRLAIVIQTQYTLHLGNDYTQGSSSMSTGGLNASFQRPEKRDIYAPGVKEMLRIARVFVFQDFSLRLQKNNVDTNLLNNYYDKSVSDTRFVKNYQENGTAGTIAVLDNNKMVSFQNPSDITFKNYQANEILDTNDNTYKTIDKVDNIAWVSGFNKNVNTIPETETQIQTALDNLPQLKLISVYGGQILSFPTQNDYEKFKQVTNTTDDNFTDYYVNGSTWIYKYCPNNIETQAYYTFDLDNNADFENLKAKVDTNTTNITNLQNKALLIDTNQTITGSKTITNTLKIKQVSKVAPFIQFQNASGAVLSNVGYTNSSGVNANIFNFNGVKIINAPNLDTTSSDFTNTCLVPKSYVDSKQVNWNPVPIDTNGVSFELATANDSSAFFNFSGSFWNYMTSSTKDTSGTTFQGDSYFYVSTLSAIAKVAQNGTTYTNQPFMATKPEHIATKQYVDNAVTELKYFETEITYSRDFLGRPNTDTGVVFTLIEIADKNYEDRDLLFIETKITDLAEGRKQRRYSVLQIGTDNSLLYCGGEPSDGSMSVGKSVRIYYR